MKLISEMSKLGERVLYYDTDSIIFVSQKGDYEPLLADFLGEFTNEVKAQDGSYIKEFVSAGPKNYAYMLDTGKTFCKIKGFTVNFITGTKLNFESMKDLVLSRDKKKKISVEQNKFIRDKSKWIVKTEIINKLYRQVYDKRYIFNKGPNTRTISLNAHYIIMFKNPRDRSQISFLARQMYPKKSKFLEDAYDDATQNPHSYLIMDLKQSTHEDLRVQTAIFPGENRYAYLPLK